MDSEDKTIELHFMADGSPVKIRINDIDKIYKFDKDYSSVDLKTGKTIVVRESIKEIFRLIDPEKDKIEQEDYNPEYELLKKMNVAGKEGFREETDGELASRLALACVLLGERLDSSAIINTSGKERPLGFFARRAVRLAGEVLERVEHI